MNTALLDTAVFAEIGKREVLLKDAQVAEVCDGTDDAADESAGMKKHGHIAFYYRGEKGTRAFRGLQEAFFNAGIAIYLSAPQRDTMGMERQSFVNDKKGVDRYRVNN